MLLKSELPFASDIPVLDDDPALFDPDPDWADDFGLAALEDDDLGDLGLRAVIERPEALSKAWKHTRSMH